MIAQRRKAEDADDLALFFGTPPQLQPKPDEVDDLGRVIPSANPAASRADRAAARAARRLHRRAANQQRQVEEEGYSTDGELPPADADDYRVAMGKLVADAQAIMADVKAEEFRDASAGVGKWFGEWRAKFDEVYRGAWGGLGMVSAWEFWARLEILGWNPLEVCLKLPPVVRCMCSSVTVAHSALQRPRSLDSFRWYSALYKYSRPSLDADEDEDDEPELGPDGDLVSAMISTALIPRICRIIESGALDAYSASDVRRLVDLTEQVEASVDKQSLKFEVRSLLPLLLRGF